MRFHITTQFESVGGQWTLIFFGVHWGNRIVGFTVLNVVVELEY